MELLRNIGRGNRSIILKHYNPFIFYHYKSHVKVRDKMLSASGPRYLSRHLSITLHP